MEADIQELHGITVEIKYWDGNPKNLRRITEQQWLFVDGEWVLSRETNRPV